MKKVLLLSIAALFLFGITAFAGPEHDHSKQAQQTEMNGMEKTIEGTIICLDCTLKKESGARASCKTNGCNFGLKTADGKFIHLLHNKYSQDLLDNKDYHDKPITLTGTYFANADMFDVASFTVDGHKKTWCDHCNKMDGCMAKK